MYIFTDTITTLPFGFYVKVEIIADSGTTGTLTVTNGGYIQSISPITKEQEPTGYGYKPGDVSLALRNIGDVWSTNVFTTSQAIVECRIWLSYDSGSTWENLFFGFIDPKSWTYSDIHDTVTTNRVYNCTAYHAILKLKDIALPDDFSAVGEFAGTNNITESIPCYTTEETGLQVGPVTTGSFVFAQVQEFLGYIVGKLSSVFLASGMKPTMATDFTQCYQQAYNMNTATGYAFDKLYLHYTNNKTNWQAYGLLGSHFMDFTGKVSAYDAVNFQELLKRWCDWLMIMPIMTLTVSGGVYTCTTKFVARMMPTSSAVAVTGPLTAHYSRSFALSQWYDSAHIATPGLAVQHTTTMGTQGKQMEMRNWFTTSPDFGVDPYIFIQCNIVAGTENITNTVISAQQLFVKIDSTHVRMAHQFRHDPAQAYQEPATTGYYGIHLSLFNLAQQMNPDLLIGSLNIGRRGLNVKYKTLKGASIADIDLLKKIVYGGVSYRIMSVSRDIATNETNVSLVEFS